MPSDPRTSRWEWGRFGRLAQVTMAPSPLADDLSAILAPYLSLLARVRQGTYVDAGRDSTRSAPSIGLASSPSTTSGRRPRRSCGRMRGRAILADEVGLGKTIEAGLVLSELRVRGLADRALVIGPAGLTQQWREELERKFALPTTIAVNGEWNAGSDHPVVIAWLAAARREPLKSALTHRQWDAVFMDEAHRLRNPRGASGRLARA